MDLVLLKLVRGTWFGDGLPSVYDAEHGTFLSELSR